VDGVLNVRKASGPTSHDVVNCIRHIFKQKRVGHAGTLDPMATGVLVVCLGKATRLVEYLTNTRKHYRAILTLGIVTDTQDATGNILVEKDASGIDIDQMRRATAAFAGEIKQIPPMISAIKHQGKPLYKHAREGRTIERSPRPVTIYSIEASPVRNMPEGTQSVQVELKVECSSGTYIRTLCADIGDYLGCGGMMAALERTRVGSFDIGSSVTVDDLQQAANEDRLSDFVVPMAKAVGDMPGVEADDAGIRQIAHGLPIAVMNDLPVGSHARITYGDDLIAIGIIAQSDDGIYMKPSKVFCDGV
jgi:tRNA pseudouridine55 synthase